MKDAVISIKRGIDDIGEKVDRGFQVCVQQIYCLGPITDLTSNPAIECKVGFEWYFKGFFHYVEESDMTCSSGSSTTRHLCTIRLQDSRTLPGRNKD
jgi:hypothetical protein